MAKIDDVLNDFHYQSRAVFIEDEDCAYYDSKLCDCDMPKLKQALYADLLELIGEDTTWNQQEAYTNPDTVQGYNEALSDIRDKLKSYMGIE